VTPALVQQHLQEVAARADTTRRAAERLSVLIEVDPEILHSSGIARRVAQLSMDSEAERDEVAMIVLTLLPPVPWHRRLWRSLWVWVVNQAGGISP
jgi:hypothetical protein